MTCFCGLEGTVYLATSSLPAAIQNVLRGVSYGKADIRVDTAESISPADFGSDGRKAFFAVVNLATGQNDIQWGSWGGPNIYNPQNRVDLDTQSYPIPPGVAVIKGSIGGQTWATVYVAPETMAPLLPPAPAAALSKLDQCVLVMYKSLTSAGRKDEAIRKGIRPSVMQEAVMRLAALGFLKVNKAGSAQVTTAGKNFVASLPREQQDVYFYRAGTLGAGTLGRHY